MLNWFSSYLDRTQRVRYNGMISKEFKFKCGIPQGSCLGPALFIFYINDVLNHIDGNLHMKMFADDCVLYKSGVSCDRILTDLQNGPNSYEDWGCHNDMHLNASKTKTMLVKPQKTLDVHVPVVSKRKNIQFVNTFNYLGVILDDQLSFTPNYNMVKRKMEHTIFVLTKIRKYIDKKTAVLIYKQAVLPLVEYAGFVLVSCSIGQKYELQVLQNNALRLCLGYRLLDRVQIDHLHNDCKKIGLEQRWRKQLLRLMYLHSKSDSNIKKSCTCNEVYIESNFQNCFEMYYQILE